MAAKRAKFVHRISGRDDPVVQFIVHNRSSAQPSKASRGTHRKRPPSSRIVTFSAEGSLRPNTEQMTQLPYDGLPEAVDTSALDEFEFVLDDLAPTNEMPELGETNPSRKTANIHLASWLAESSQDYLATLYDREAPPATGLCDECHQEAKVLYRCQSCHSSSQSCAACLVSAHRRLPTHRIERWDEAIWTEASLSDLGYILCLGHHGATCTDNRASSDILVGDLNGFTTVNVKYCTHPGAPSKALQLLSIGLFPCSDLHPRSAFTITLLETYNVFLTLGRTSAHKFYSVLERLTKPGFPGDVKDRYQELMATHRKYLFLLNLQRSGSGFANHNDDEHPGDQALDCVACPRLGTNFDWVEVLENERPWFRTFMSYDGNFRSVRKSKKVEEGDLCLSDDLGYFSAKEPYKEWTEQVAQKHPQRTEKPICDHHKAGNDTSVRWAGQDVTGIGALTCTSHSCFVPRGMVDFFKGERFIYADYVFASAVSHLTRRGPLTFGLTYDVWCHWIVNFNKRAENLPPSISLPRSFDLVGGIPKFHLPGHAQVCYVRYSLDHTQYVGRMEGEGPERVWAHLNQHSGSTSGQGPGVRTDTINNLAYEWNYEKMIRMVQHLLSKFKEAKKVYRQQKAVHDDLASSLPHDKVIEWEATPLEPVRDRNGKWSSPLMDPVWTGE
ncbi:hypothetical protein FRC08_013918 [Ceratobasidium sp. 394]|nr:hypothetical protein FRC08_013918 [Ceratobasidium sp. 394]